MDNKKMTALLKMGYFLVTDDFWAGAGMPHYIGKGFDWALRMPLSQTQPFMPWHGLTLEKKTLEKLQMAAARLILSTTVQ